ncbi:hypothetical protein KW798_01365 [Candidatus Parcubacteria bacterium]|nr:hypothetical protein [Candidatus Parcubacteria bacterium]
MSIERPSFESLTLKPQKIEAPGANKAEFLPQRGGNIASIKIRGKELLYMNQVSLMDPSGKPVRGGVPNLFPYAGELDSPLYPNLKKRHGFGRDEKWDYSIAPDKKSFTEFLPSNFETKENFPYNFLAELGGQFNGDKFTITQSVQNQDKRPMPIAFGLHPYFKVNNADKRKIGFNFAGGEELEKRKEEWMNGSAVIIDNPKKHALNAEMPITIPGIGTLVLEASREYQQIVVWSDKDQGFVCIEPWMRKPGGLADDPEFVDPNEIYTASFSIKLES